MNIVLLGVKHSGKSSIGKMLSVTHNIPFFDTDLVIEETCKIGVRAFYTKYGKDLFMQKEAAACDTILQRIKERQEASKIKRVEKTEKPEDRVGKQDRTKEFNALIATGGGICDNKLALNILRPSSVFVFLSVKESVLLNRILLEATRSLGTKTDKTEQGFYQNLPAFITAKLSPSYIDVREQEEEIKKIFHTFFTNREGLYKKVATITVHLEGSDKENNANEIEANANRVWKALTFL